MEKILKEDFDLLVERIINIEKDIAALGDEFKEAVNQSSETWHDNAPFDVVRDKQVLLAQERAQLLAIRTASHIYKPKKSNKVTIGSVVSFEGKDEISIFIAGSWTARKEVKGAVVITQNAPIAQLLLGKRVGDDILMPKGRLKIANIVLHI